MSYVDVCPQLAICTSWKLFVKILAKHYLSSTQGHAAVILANDFVSN